MNILVFAPRYAYENDMSVSFIHKQLKEFVTLGHKVKVIVPIQFGKKTNISKKFTIDGVSIIYLKFLSCSSLGELTGFNEESFKFFFLLKANEILNNFTPDIIYLQTLSVCTKAGSWVKSKFNCPMVMTIHGSDITIPYNQGNHIIIRRRLIDIDKIVCVSSRIKSFVIDIYPEKDIEIIINGFTKEPVSCVNKKELTFMQAGNLIKQKNNDITIKVFNKILKRYPNASLTIVGDGPEKEKLMELCLSLNISEHVEFTGFVENSLVRKIMANTQFFIMPSVNEGFGIVYMEAMYNKCITIGTEGEGISSFIDNGIDGFLVEANNITKIVDVITTCYENKQLMDEIVVNAYNKAKRFTWPENARKYIDVFTRLI